MSTKRPAGRPKDIGGKIQNNLEDNWFYSSLFGKILDESLPRSYKKSNMAGGNKQRRTSGGGQGGGRQRGRGYQQVATTNVEEEETRSDDSTTVGNDSSIPKGIFFFTGG